MWSNEELMEMDTYMDLVQEYKEDGKWSGSDIDMIEPIQSEEQILRKET